MDIKTVLQNLGYNPHKKGNYYSMAAIYRDGDNPTALSVHSRKGTFVDFVAGKRGSLSDLVKLTLQLKSYDEAKSWLSHNDFQITQNQSAPIIEDHVKHYNKSVLDRLIKNHEYWEGRGVNKETLLQFNGGIACSGAMANRYVFPLYDISKRIVGFAGRDLTNKSEAKWKIMGPKTKAIFPHTSPEEIRNKKVVVLVESIGDSLALCNAGISNNICLFGVHLPDEILTKLAGLSPAKIILGLNNDSDKNSVGNNNAVSIAKRLAEFFNEESIEIVFPPNGKNDWGECNTEEILSKLS